MFPTLWSSAAGSRVRSVEWHGTVGDQVLALAPSFALLFAFTLYYSCYYYYYEANSLARSVQRLIKSTSLGFEVHTFLLLVLLLFTA